jgi:type VI secretion system secreted protein VgrG
MSSLRYPPLRAFASPSLTQSNRAFRLHWVSAQSSLEQVLIAHRIDISEGLCSGIVGHVTCLSTRADLPLNAFIGLPLSVQMVTDRGALHPICAIVTDARADQSDGSLATYQLTLRDALSVLEGRTNMRIFRTLSVPDVIGKLLGESQKNSPALARVRFRPVVAGSREVSGARDAAAVSRVGRCERD